MCGGFGHFVCSISNQYVVFECSLEYTLEYKYQRSNTGTTCGDAVSIGASCSFDCAEENYAPQGDGELDCYEGGILETETCLPTCNIQGQVPGSHNCGNFLTHDSFCEFTCEDGYVPSDGIEVRSVRARGARISIISHFQSH